MESGPRVIQFKTEEFEIGISPIMGIKEDQNILSSNELEELKKINHPSRIRSWWKAREVLSDISIQNGINYKGLHKGSNGKPHFIEGSPYHCSLSHTMTHAAAMISKRSCGIDIEKIHPKVERIFQKFSNEDEIEGRNDLKIKTALWACKESIYKAVDVPGIHFREQIVLDKWTEDGADFYFHSSGKQPEFFQCQIEWFNGHVLAFTLQKNIQE